MSEGRQGHVTPCADPDIDNLPDRVDDDDDRSFYGAISGESAQHVGVKQKLLDPRDQYWGRKQSVWTNVAEAEELAQEIQLLDAGVLTVQSSKVAATTDEDDITLAVELDKGKARLAGMGPHRLLPFVVTTKSLRISITFMPKRSKIEKRPL